MINVLNRLLEPKMNGPEIAHLFVNLLKVDISNSTLSVEIENHPEYPSLLSISDVLKNFGIDNIGVKVDGRRISEMPLPLIAQVKGERTEYDFFTVVRDINDSTVSFFDPEFHKWKNVPKNDFLERSSGVVLLAHAGSEAGEKDYKIKVKQEQRKTLSVLWSVLVIPALVVISGILGLTESKNSIFPFLFSMVTLCGCVISCLLLLYELDQHNPLLQQICSSGKKVNCSSVLQSNGSKIMGLSWSLIGFTYFTGMLLLGLSDGMTISGYLFTIAWINAAALPYIFFSVYYQWRIAKQWCALCLSVLLTLLIQFIIISTQHWYTSLSWDMLTMNLVIKVLVCFTVPLLSAKLILPALERAKEVRHIKTELQKIKNDKVIFGTLLQSKSR